MIERWNILCPGPSLHAAEVGRSTSAATVALNAAINYRGGCDYWCVQDPPQGFDWFAQFKDAYRAWKPTLWWEERTLRDVPLRLPWLSRAVVEDTEATKRQRHLLGWREVDVYSIWFNRSLWTAVLKCVLAGAKEIRLFGSDMTGFADYDPATGAAMPNGKPREWWDSRWAEERRIRDVVTQHLALEGTALVVIEP